MASTQIKKDLMARRKSLTARIRRADASITRHLNAIDAARLDRSAANWELSSIEDALRELAGMRR